MNHWSVLGIEPTNDKAAIKKAYAKLLKQHRPDKDPEGYQRLREAFDWACAFSKSATQSQSTGKPVVKTQSCEMHESVEPDPKMILVETRGEEVWPTRPVSDEMQGEKPELDSLDYSEAILAAKKVFNTPTELEGIALFKSLLKRDVLLSIKARACFERTCLNILSNWDSSVPLELVNDLAKEFHWFDRNHIDRSLQEQIEYVRVKCEARYMYLNTIQAASQSADFINKYSAKLLQGKCRPVLFRILRFIGIFNVPIRQVTRYLNPVVHGGHCPELDNASFHWWSQEIERCRLSWIHCLMALFMIGLANIFFELPKFGSSPPYFGSVLTYVVGLTSVLWGLDYIFRYDKRCISLWYRIKPLLLTKIILSVLFIVSTWIWGEFRGVEHIFWLMVLAFLSAWLLVGKIGVIFILVGALLYFVCYTIVDPIGHYSQLTVQSFNVAFVAYRLFVWSLLKMPTKFSDIIRRNIYLVCGSYLGILITMSLCFLLVAVNL